jgi:TonB-linked SusC/RagA family outer membrane protein
MNKRQLLKRVLFIPLFVLLALIARSQSTTVSGKVADVTGLPLPGVSILIKGATKGVATDANGNYAISANSTDVLVFSMLGYLSQEIPIKQQTNINVQLKDEPRSLNEVVVVGYGTVRRKDLTGSVSSVRGDEFKNQPITNAVDALQGRVAGVNIVKASGAPDAQPSIIIRGLASLNQPNPLYIVDGARVNDISNVNVQDIESLDVLKDAAAASIYGAAAAGGVVLITTKKGTTSTPAVNYNMRYGVTKAKVGELLDKEGYLSLQNIVRPTIFANATPAQLAGLANTDWIDEIFNDATEQNHNISLSGAAPIVNYLVSGFYNKQDGVARKNFSNIGGARINTDFKLGKLFKFGEQLAISRRSTSNPQNIGVEAQLHNAPFRTIPIIPVFNQDGTYGTLPTGFPGLAFSGTHPVGAVDNAHVENFRNNLQANIYGEVQLPFGLSFRSTVGYSFYNETQNYFQNAFSIGGVGAGANSLSKLAVESQSLLTNFVLSYNHTFAKHNISALAGFEQITNKFNNANTMATNVSPAAAEQYSFIPTASTTYLFTGQKDNNGLIKSFFGRLNYNFAGKYYLSGSIRQDANFTVFGPNNQRGIFPAGSAAWNIAEEPFFKSALPVFNSLKLRASYGELGNSNIPAYSFLSLYQSFNSFGNGSAGGANFSSNGTIIPGNSFGGIPNADLHWETVKEFNIGLDAELIKNKVYVTAEWYNKTTEDMLYALPLAPSAGISGAYLTNIGSVNNKGFELLLGFRSKINKLNFDLTFTGGYNKNEVTKLSDETSSALYDGYNYYNNGDVAFQQMPNQTITITRKGLPFGSFFGYKSLGIFATDAEAAVQKVNGNIARAGDLHFEDLDGNGLINDLDRQVIGNPNPKFVYGFNLRFNIKGFDANFLFNGVAGVDLFNGVKAYEMRPFQDGNASPKVFGASFLGTNGLTDQPRLGVPVTGGFTMDPNSNYSTVNSYFVEKGDYLKLKNLQIGYTFSGIGIQKLKIKSARIFVMGNNLFTITKYTGLDPELGASFSPSGYSGVTARGIDVVSQYPQTRIYSFGVDINF